MKTTYECAQQEVASKEFSSSATLSSLSRPPRRNLGCGILVAAIEDYLSLEDQAHASAARFLFPSRPVYQEHYDWVVSMADGVNRAWLRDALDRARPGWDRQRLHRKLEQKLAQSIRARMTA